MWKAFSLLSVLIKDPRLTHDSFFALKSVTVKFQRETLIFPLHVNPSPPCTETLNHPIQSCPVPVFISGPQTGFQASERSPNAHSGTLRVSRPGGYLKSPQEESRFSLDSSESETISRPKVIPGHVLPWMEPQQGGTELDIWEKDPW